MLKLRALTAIAAVATLLALFVSMVTPTGDASPAPAPLSTGETFLERFALSPDRRATLAELVPGTEDHDYYSCLVLQQEGDLAGVDRVLQSWRKREKRESARYVQIEARQVLLKASEDPAATFTYLERELGLHFNHRRAVPGEVPNLPTAFDVARYDTARLIEEKLASRRASEIRELGPALLERLVGRRLRDDQREVLLDALERADVPGLTEVVLADFRANPRLDFGGRRIHGKLTLAQLEELRGSMPALASSEAWVHGVLRRLAPGPSESMDDPASRDAYLDRLWRFVETLPPVFNSLKAHVLHRQIERDLDEGAVNADRLKRYLRLPRRVWYVPTRAKSGDFPVDLGQGYDGLTPFRAIGDETPLVEEALEALFRVRDSADEFLPLLERDYLRRIFARTKLLYGDPARADRYVKDVGGPAALEALRAAVEIEFARSNDRRYRANDEVTLDLVLKNVDSLIVKAFKIDPVAVFDRFGELRVSTLDLDGLVAGEELTLEYSQPPLSRHAESLPLPSLTGPGTYVVELIGGGVSSRAVIRKGALHLIGRVGSAGHAFTVLDQDRQPVADAVLRYGGRDFATNDNGEIIVPFTQTPGVKTVLLRSGGTAAMARFSHLAESYDLEAPSHVTTEALLAGMSATFATRPRLTLAGETVPLELLEDRMLTVQSTNRDGDVATKVVTDLDLDGGEVLTTIEVPERASIFQVRLSGTVRSISDGQDVPIASEWSTFRVASIAPGSPIQSLLVRGPEGYALEVRGRNGEPEVDRQVTVQLEHGLVSDQPSMTLKTDAVGRIDLGPLTDVKAVRVTSPGPLVSRWVLDTVDHVGMAGSIHARAGEPVLVPYTGTYAAVDRGALSLVEMRADVPLRDAFGSASIDRRYVVLRDLPAGAYVLTLKESGARYSIRVVDGAPVAGHIVGDDVAVTRTRRIPLQIAGVSRGDDSLVVQLGGFGPSTRLHVVATRFVDPYEVADDLALDPRDRISRSVLMDPRSTYESGRVISDEYEYILARRRATPYPGNMLDRPGVLLNPWVVNDTTDRMLLDGETGGAYRGAGDAAPPAASASERRRARGRMGKKRAASPAEQQLLDFLAESTALVAGLRPDEKGRVTIPIAALGSKQDVRIVAIDDEMLAAMDVVREPEAPLLRDRRLLDGLDHERALLQQRRIAFVEAGESLTLRDGLSVSTTTFDTLGGVYDLFMDVTGSQELAKFSFLKTWGAKSAEEKAELYSEFVCHELNVFLRRKDPAFFAEVVRPYIANKGHRTFMDRWLLGEDLASYLEPWAFERLNAVEKILLLRQVDGDAASVAADLLATLPRGTFSMDKVFGRVLATGALSDAPGLASALDEVAKNVAPRPAPSRSRVESQAVDRADEKSDSFFLGKAGGGGGAFGGRQAVGAEVAPLEAPEEEDAEELLLAEAIDVRAVAADDDLGIRYKSEGFFYRDLADTKELAETHYWRVRLSDMDGDLIGISPFWVDFAKSAPGRFVSSDFPLATRSDQEMLLALALLDLPFEAGEHGVAVDGRAVTMTAASPLYLAVEDIVEATRTDSDSTLLVGQDYFRVDRRFETRDGVQRERYVTEEFLTGEPYGCRVVLTNPSSQGLEVEALLQIPEGAIELGDTRVTRGIQVTIPPYGTQSIETTFYFPSPGTFPAFPVHVGAGDVLVGSAEARTLRAVEELSEVDRTTWEWISQNGSLDDVLAYLDAENPRVLDLSKVAWRMSDRAAFDAVTARLDRRNVYHPTLWQYAVKHRSLAATRTFLQTNATMLSRVGMAFESELLTVDPRERASYEHLSYDPLVPGRILRFGDQERIQNDQFKTQYERFLGKLALQRGLTDDDRLELVEYLLAQHRTSEALAAFESIDPGRADTDIQYDYAKAYFGFTLSDLATSREVALRYAEHPVQRWRSRFQNVLGQIDEIEGRGPTDAVDPDDRDQSQGALAGREPVLSVRTEAGQVIVDHERVEEIEIRYHAMDVEFLFSNSPFVQNGSGAFGLVEPNRRDVVRLPEGETQSRYDIPAAFAGTNVLVEVRGAGLARRDTYFAGATQVQGLERYGQIRVVDAREKTPLPKTYVKVYAQLADGRVRFHKDGYTDLRGRFDYVSLSGETGPPVVKYAVLAMNDDVGATMTEVLPPAR